jgi:hypothetical protein
MYGKLSASFLLSCLLILISCSKDEDKQGPVITIQAPDPGIEINIPDTLDVKVKVTDNKLISSVFITIVNADYNEVIQRKSYMPDNQDFYVETAFSLTDKNLASGDYFIKVTALDGQNTTSEYLEIRINEIPLVLNGFVAITSQIGLKSTIFSLNPAYEADTQFIINDSYQLSALNSNWEQFFFISNEPSVLTSYSLNGFDPGWELGAAPPRAEITAIISEKELIFSTANGDVTILDRNGNIRLRTIPYENKTITHLAADSSFIYISLVSLSGNINEMTVLYRVTGEIRDQKSMSGEIKGLASFRGAAYVFMQSGNDIAVFSYDNVKMLIQQQSIIYNQQLLSTENLADQEIFLLTENAVFSFNPVNNSFVFFTFEPYKFCRYDYLNDDVFLARDKTVYRFDRVSGYLVSQKEFTDEVLDFQVVYNK